MYAAASQIFYPVHTVEELIKLLHEIDPMTLAKGTYQKLNTVPLSRRGGEFTWAPIVECMCVMLLYKESEVDELLFFFPAVPDAIEPFLQTDPIEVLLSDDYDDDKDLLIGHTSNEAYLLLRGDMVFKPAINYAREIEIGLPVKFEDIDFHSEVE